MSISVSDELTYEALTPEIKELCERIFASRLANLKQEVEDAHAKGYQAALENAISAINNL